MTKAKCLQTNFSRVYRYDDVVIKVAHPKYAESDSIEERTTKDRRAEQLLMNEYSALVQMEDCREFPSAESFWRVADGNGVLPDSETGRLALVEEAAPGETLKSALEKHLAMSPSGWGETVALAYADKLLSGVVALHIAGILHRDLHPGNQLITRRGRLTIIDLGCSCRIDAHPSDAFSCFGFEPPEIHEGKPYTVRGEICSCAKNISMVAYGTFDTLKMPHTPMADVLTKNLSTSPSLRAENAMQLSQELHRACKLSSRALFKAKAIGHSIGSSLH